MTKSTAIKLGLAVLIGGLLFTQWDSNQRLKSELRETRNQIALLTAAPTSPATLERSTPTENSDQGKGAPGGSALNRFQ